MHLPLGTLSLKDFILDDHWDLFSIEYFLGPNVNLEWLLKVHIEQSEGNNWIWWPNSSYLSMVLIIYPYLSKRHSITPAWDA